jgi:hypothetical protein
MKVYISWSKTLSYFVANQLVTTFAGLFPGAVDVYFSAVSNDKGKDWFLTNQDQLLSASRALILASRSNLSSPWLLYEAGALLNHARTQCEILLIDVATGELSKHPFGHFQCTECTSADFEKTFTEISEAISLVEHASSFHDAVQDARTNITLLARAEQQLECYRRAARRKSRAEADGYMYNACLAMTEASMKPANIQQWFDMEGISPVFYAKHLVSLQCE